MAKLIKLLKKEMVMHAVIIEQSLRDKKVLDGFKILKTKKSGNWDLHILEIENSDEAIKIIQPAMVKERPYYWHIYDEGKTLIVVFREKIFRLDPKDKKTWKEAQGYGSKLLKIPAEQLDFYPTTYVDEPEWLAGKD